MALNKAQSKAVAQEWKAEIDALDAQIVTAQTEMMRARNVLAALVKQRDPLAQEVQMIQQRHERLFNEQLATRNEE